MESSSCVMLLHDRRFQANAKRERRSRCSDRAVRQSDFGSNQRTSFPPFARRPRLLPTCRAYCRRDCQDRAIDRSSNLQRGRPRFEGWRLSDRADDWADSAIPRFASTGPQQGYVRGYPKADHDSSRSCGHDLRTPQQSCSRFLAGRSGNWRGAPVSRESQGEARFRASPFFRNLSFERAN